MCAIVFDRYSKPDVMSLRDVTVPEAHEMVVPCSPALTCKTRLGQTARQSLAVSVLDLIATQAGEPATSAIARAVELARHVEQLGYKRRTSLRSGAGLLGHTGAFNSASLRSRRASIGNGGERGIRTPDTR